jgi:hypothetical protein
MTIKRRLMAAAALAGLALIGVTQALTASAGTSTASPAPDPFASYVVPTGPELPLERIEGIATAQASRAGESTPAEISVGKGSLEDAMRSVDPSTSVSGASSPGYRAMLATPVDLVVMHGHFTLNDAHVPRGVQAPGGPVLDLIIDAHTGFVIGRALPDPSLQQTGLALARVASSTPLVNGVIAGRLSLGGGPPFLRHRRVASDHIAVVATRGSQVVARTTTRRAGVFSIRISPGIYQIAAKLPSGQRCAAVSVVVRPRKTSHTGIVCNIK